MGSLEEESLVQMVQDFIESDTVATNSISCSPVAFSLHQHTCLMLEGILSSATDAEMKVLEKALKYVGEMGDDRKRSTVRKRLMMKLRKDGYDASLCRTSWVASLECPGGNYEYIDVAVAEEKGASTRLIVDIDFRSQFELARPTSAYSQLSSTIPSIFVGTEEKLKRVVSLLCSAVQQSFKERGLHIPPWRRSIYMQSKWLSCCHKAYSIPFLNYPTGGRKEEGKNGSSQIKDVDDGSKGGLSSQFSNLRICC